jgi:serine phosphatase RsbU (regulator of sigma subunit)
MSTPSKSSGPQRPVKAPAVTQRRTQQSPVPLKHHSDRAVVGSDPHVNGPRRATGSGGAAGTRPKAIMRPGTRKLRHKFMVVLAGVTAAVMVLLGLLVAQLATTYLFAQKQHDGIELAKMAAQIANAAALTLDDLGKDSGGRVGPDEIKRVQERIVAQLRDAARWDESDSGSSDLLAVTFNATSARFPAQQLTGTWLGDPETSNALVVEHYRTVFVPKSGTTINLADYQLALSELLSPVKDLGTVRIYRFKAALGGVFGIPRFDPSDAQSWNTTPHVRIDIDVRSIDKAITNLYATIAFSVILAIALVIGVANWLAGRVTQPIEMLVKDMKIVAQGKLDHETLPHSDDEVGLAAVEFNRMTHQLYEAQSALVEQEKAEYELSIAREVQKQMLPLDATTTPYPDGGAYYEFTTIAGWSVGAYYKGAKAVSGDYFDVIDLGNGLWGFCIADVSGKGIPGSMVMAVTRTIVRLVAGKHRDRPAETLKETNRLIAKQIKRGMFVTVFYAVLDDRSGHLTYASAGHNPMVIWRHGSKAPELATSKGIAVGFNDGPIFDKTIESHATDLREGDGFSIYTDGFPEAMNAKNQEFGDERFYQTLAANGHLGAQQLISVAVAEVAKHRADAEQSDDLTIIVARRV